MKSARTLFTILVLYAFSFPFAFSQECGTEVKDANLDVLNELNEAWRLHQLASGRTAPDSMIFVPVQLHIIRTSAGGGGISAAELMEAFDLANEYFSYSKIHFYQVAPINYINDNTYSSYDYSEMNALNSAHSVNNVINIYTADDVRSGGTPICGHSQFPGGLDFIILATSCAMNGSTFTHELGHYFGLYHTHEPYYGNELVNGSNCTTAGDLICDTPADPSLSGRVNSNGCIYTYGGTDGNGQTYTPQVSNMMSYSAKECRVFLSDEQYDRMTFVYQNYRTYLNGGVMPALKADFYAYQETGCGASGTVQFADISEGNTTTWEWDFDDASPVSTAQHPTHTYAVRGVYSVRLVVGDGSSTDTLVRDYVVTYNPGVQPPYGNGFEDEPSAAEFWQWSSYKNRVFVDPVAALSGPSGLVFDGYPANRSAYFRTPSSATAFDSLWNPMYKSEISTCVDATANLTLTLEFDIYQLYAANNNYTNFRVLVDGNPVSPVYQPGGTDGPWEHKIINLDAYAGTSFELTFEGSHKYTHDYSSGTATFLDQVLLHGTVPLAEAPISFEVVPEQNSVLLNWEIPEASGNWERFVIERSKDLVEWETVLAGDRHSSRKQSVDDFPFGGLSYYRLAVLDARGEMLRAEVREVRITRSRVVLYPNPATEKITLRFDAEAEEPPVVYSTTGEVLRLPVVRTVSGFELDIRQLPAGMYFLRFAQNTTFITRSFSKQ